MTDELKELMVLIEIYNPEHKPMTIEAIKALAEQLPMPKAPIGKWEVNGTELKCSNCGAGYSFRHRYCPNCGSWMPRII